MQTLAQLKLITLVYALSLVIIGYIVARFVSNRISSLVAHHGSKHIAMLVKRISFYTIIIIFLVMALQQLGFNLTVLLGAAGVFSVALSFASQTAASNLISGIFLLFERPFKAGDIIQIKNFTGTVNTIDLLSTKIATFDNQLVRIPNEMLIKTEMVNLSYFPTRRADIDVGVGYDTDLDKARQILEEIASESEYALPEPKAATKVMMLADSAITMRLSVWTKTENLGALKTQLQQLIQQRFSQNGIDIPFPQMTVTVNQADTSA